MRICGYATLVLIAGLSLHPTPSLTAGIMENMVFSDRDYARCIEAHGWVATGEQVSRAFSNQEDPVQLPYGELVDKYAYFVVRLKNLEPYRAWGMLVVNCPDIGSVIIDVMNVAPRLDRPEYYVMPLGDVSFSGLEPDNRPQFSFKWKKLYVK